MSQTSRLIALDTSYSYQGHIAALQNLSLELAPGDRLALIGLNGSGKTTLAKCLAGLIRPDSGQVLLDGQPVHSLSPGELAAKIGFVFQNPDHQIFQATVRQEISFGLENLGLEGGRLERRVGEALTSYGLTEQAEKPPASLSYGMRRKVTVASVAAMKPAVLVLDEPSLGLDWGSATSMLDALFAQTDSAAIVILISHDLQLVARYARETALLDQGQLVMRLSTRQLFQEASLLERHGLNAPPLAHLAAAIGVESPEAAYLQVQALAEWVNRRLEAGS